ncbi:MAG TPA: hypothetical protein VIG30_09300 [Ktedonobacterales bacterium]|jgi:hypothetical protein
MALLSSRIVKPATLVLVVLSLMACGSTTTIVQGGGGSPTAPAATATSTATPAPTATATPAPGVCDPAAFPTKTNGGPGGFQYPPLTYSYDETPGAGNHPYLMCSSGNPSSILAFMKTSVAAAGWKIVSSTATTLSAQQPTNPPSGFCYEDDITVNLAAAYPGQWEINEHPPIPPCQ